jgi:sugar phosphate isomerase/epimerase
MSYKIGLIGMIREELKEDRWGTLKHMAGIGYQGIEGGFLISEDKAEMRDNRKRMEDLGLETVAVNCSQYKEEELDQAIENAHVLGAKFVGTYWAGPETEEETLQLAEQLERMAAKCAAADIRYFYHNHEHEFVAKLGEQGRGCIFEVLYENTEKLNFELDVAWCHFGGANPVNVIQRCGQRIPILHVKDLADDGVRGHFCAVGMGKVDCFGSIAAAALKGTQWMVVEQDKPGFLTHYESAMASMFNIREAGLHPHT